jgi:hypothetical protein
VNVSTKWVNPGYREETPFKVRASTSVVTVSLPTREPLRNRLTPRRIAAGVLRRAKRLLPMRVV